MSLWEYGRQYVSRFLQAPAGLQYHGLINQGATCYLNSVLQVLFMTKDFRDVVKRYSSENPENEEHIDPHLSAMFDLLEHQTVNTYAITEKLGIQRVYEQQDAAEYFQRILQLTSPEASKIFHGVMSHRTSCHECLRQADVDGPFWCLPLALMDSSSDVYSVEDGVEQYFRATEFRGENQMYCDDCDCKVDADTKYVIKHHPDVLVLLLKRFDFSYRHMSYIKINCAVNVPLMLQIPETHTYELYAAVDHQGDLRSGHYNATIKSEDDDRWYWFDDTSVGVLYNQPFLKETSEQSQTAYLLFYRKKKMTFDHNMEVCTNETVPVTPSDNSELSQNVENGGEREEEEERRNSNTTGMISVGSPILCFDEEEDKDIKGKDRDHIESLKDEENVREVVVGEMSDSQRRLIDVPSEERSNSRQDQEASATQTGHEGVNMQEQVREQEDEDDREQCQKTAGSGRRGESPTGSQRVNDDEETELENPKGKERKQCSKHAGVQMSIDEEESCSGDGRSMKREVIETKSDNDDQSLDAENGGEREEEEERRNMTDDNEESFTTGIVSAGSSITCCEEVSRSHSHRDSDEGKSAACGDPQGAEESIKQERYTRTDRKEDEQRKGDEDDRRGQIGTDEGKPDCEARKQNKPKEDQRFKHGDSSREERGVKENNERQDQETSSTQTEHDVNMKKRVREQEDEDDREQRQSRAGSGRSMRGSLTVSNDEETTVEILKGQERKDGSNQAGNTAGERSHRRHADDQDGEGSDRGEYNRDQQRERSGAGSGRRGGPTGSQRVNDEGTGKQVKQRSKQEGVLIRIVEDEFRDGSMKTEIIETKTLKSTSQSSSERVSKPHRNKSSTTEAQEDSELIHLTADTSHGFSDLQLEAAEPTKDQHREKEKTVKCYDIFKCFKPKKRKIEATEKEFCSHS